MAEGIRVQVTGLKELTRTLTRGIPARTRGRVLSRTYRRAFAPMREKARQLAGRSKDISSQALAESVEIWRDRRTERREARAIVMRLGPRRSNKRALRLYYDFYDRTVTPELLKLGIRHGHLKEFGTQHHPANPFLRPALDAEARPGIERFRRIFGEEIEREAARAAKRQAKRNRGRRT